VRLDDNCIYLSETASLEMSCVTEKRFPMNVMDRPYRLLPKFLAFLSRSSSRQQPPVGNERLLRNRTG